MTVQPRVIVLWDIDNTLLYTGGAGTLGMTRAFERLYGVADAFGRVEFSGRSDRAIFRDAALSAGIAPPDLELETARFIDAYAPELERALGEVAGSLMPGIRAILERLAALSSVVQGLGTGNFRATGIAKLKYYGIAHHFPDFVGGFGDDHELREELVRIGIARLQDNAAADRVVVVGDTPHDVAAARANGAFSIAVATGRDSEEVLAAAGADVVLRDLSETDRTMSIIVGE